MMSALRRGITKSTKVFRRIIMYSVDISKAHLILGYSDVFDGEKPDIVEMIQGMNMHKLISIISEFIQVRDAKCNPIKVLGMEIRFPFETILKRDYCGITPKSPKEMMENKLMGKDKHIISLQMLLILLKKVIIYGNYDSLTNTDYTITEDDYRKVIKLQLLVADEVSKKNEEYIDTDHFLYSNYHLNYQRNVAAEFARMYYMMESLCKNPGLFEDDIQREYRNYYEDFTNKYDVSPTEYSSLLFWELYYYFSNKNFLLHESCWRNLESTYGDVKEKAKISKVIDMLKVSPQNIKEWAVQTETEEWNFTSFYSFPFLYDGEGNYISVSDVTLINAFFEKMFWLIRDCYPIEDSRAMAFFGRLFERYIQDITKDVCANDYLYVDEYVFKLRSNDRKSSDAYIRNKKDLLVVEAKGFSVLVDCMAKNERIERNNEKLFINPILQADECLHYSFADKKEFNGVEEIFIISVTLDNVNAVPNYYNAIHKEIIDKKKCGNVKYYFNFSIEEYEILISLIEKDINVFQLLREYFNDQSLEPFSNYVRNKFTDIMMTNLIQKIYKEATEKMKSILGKA